MFDFFTFLTFRFLVIYMFLGVLFEFVSELDSSVVYLCSNLFDMFVLIWYYFCKMSFEFLGFLFFEEVFDMYCSGVMGYGLYWDYMLGYWYVSMEKFYKVLFLKYEEMKEDIIFYMKKLVEFLGFFFFLEEEKCGVIEEMLKLCSFEYLKELEVNKKGKGVIVYFENKNLFSKGEVGDWVNYFSFLMVESLINIMEEKLVGLGLFFKLF